MKKDYLIITVLSSPPHPHNGISYHNTATLYWNKKYYENANLAMLNQSSAVTNNHSKDDNNTVAAEMIWRKLHIT